MKKIIVKITDQFGEIENESFKTSKEAIEYAIGYTYDVWDEEVTTKLFVGKAEVAKIFLDLTSTGDLIGRFGSLGIVGREKVEAYLNKVL